MSGRLEALEAMVRQDPKNTLARYGLAMECAQTGELERAVAEFRALIEVNPEYCYAYFHGGQTLERLQRADDARAMYRAGIEAASRSGDAHARSELEGALERLG